MALCHGEPLHVVDAEVGQLRNHCTCAIAILRMRKFKAHEKGPAGVGATALHSDEYMTKSAWATLI